MLWANDKHPEISPTLIMAITNHTSDYSILKMPVILATLFMLAFASGFFGADVSLLHPGQEWQAAMIYIDPNAQWSQYDKIMLEPVQFWDGANSTVSPTDQHTLTAYAYNK
jgi:hypothetical protein